MAVWALAAIAAIELGEVGKAVVLVVEVEEIEGAGSDWVRGVEYTSTTGAAIARGNASLSTRMAMPSASARLVGTALAESAAACPILTNVLSRTVSFTLPSPPPAEPSPSPPPLQQGTQLCTTSTRSTSSTMSVVVPPSPAPSPSCTFPPVPLLNFVVVFITLSSTPVSTDTRVTYSALAT